MSTDKALVSKSISAPTKRKKSWSMREEANGITKEVRVREADNGFIISINKYGRDITKPRKDGCDDYINEEKEYVSKTNPLASKDPEETKEDEAEFSLSNIDATINDMLGGLTI